MLVNKCLITHITGIWTITSIYSLMSSMPTQLTVYPILHIAGIFSDAFSFHAWLCVSAMTLLNVVFGLSLTLGYPLCRSSKPASCKYFNGTANRMHGCCCQLVFVIDVSLGYVQYFGDFNYFFSLLHASYTYTDIYVHIWFRTNCYHPTNGTFGFPQSARLVMPGACCSFLTFCYIHFCLYITVFSYRWC